MKTPYLYYLAPYPMHINENGLVGELYVRYSKEHNYLIFSFKYEKENHEPAPVIVFVNVSGKEFSHELFIIDNYNKIAKTGMFCPEYRVEEGIRYLKIIPCFYR